MTKIKNDYLAYYIFALLISIIILVLWQGFREKPSSVGSQKNEMNISGPKIDPNQKVFFASNGKDTAYKIKKGDKWSVLFNNVESKEYDYVSGAVFSADGSQFAFSAENAGQSFVVVNNTQEINAYQKAGYIVFNSNGTKIAFVAAKNSNSYVIITAGVGSENSTTESQSYNQIGTVTDINGNLVSIIFSPDGQQMAYVVQNNDGSVSLVVNGTTTTTYDSITNLVLNNNGTLTYNAQDGNQTVTVVNSTVVSTGDNSQNNSSNNNTNTNNNSSNSSSTSSGYRYKISTQKDINRSGDTSGNSTTSCVTGQNCNF